MLGLMLQILLVRTQNRHSNHLKYLLSISQGVLYVTNCLIIYYFRDEFI
jgi:hypothetical protein